MAIGCLATTGFDALVCADFRRAERAGYAEVVGNDPAHPLHGGRAARGPDHREVLALADERSLLFVGNSVVQTAVCPPVVRRTLGCAEDVDVAVFGAPGASALTMMRALRWSGARPGVVVVDLSPILLLPADLEAARAEATGIRRPKTPGAADAPQAAFAAAVERWLERGLASMVPPTAVRVTLPDHFRAIRDGVRFGWPAYRGALLGNLAAAGMKDGSTRIVLLNRTPGYERFRRLFIEFTGSLIRSGAEGADGVFSAIVEESRLLAAEGCRVILVDMPMAKPHRDLVRDLHAARYRLLEERLAAEPNIDFVHLGADPLLGALPFYDGHHREYPAAVEASRVMAERLRPYVPEDYLAK